MAPNTKTYENTKKFQDRISAANALVVATRQAQIQILRANGGTVTSEFMKSQIGGKYASGMSLTIVGLPPNENMQMFRTTPKRRGVKSIRKQERRAK